MIDFALFVNFLQSGGGQNIENLRNKLIAGKNEHQGGYQKFATAQFYGKLLVKAASHKMRAFSYRRY